jgi:hypothetical protein
VKVTVCNSQILPSDELQQSEGAAGVWVEVGPGQCLSSIAFEHGHLPETVWQHDNNDGLRRLRRYGDVLQTGDRLFVPALRGRTEKAPIDRRTTFCRMSVPERLRLRLLDAAGQPYARARYRLRIEGVEQPGETDKAGWVDTWVRPNARNATLLLADREIELGLGELPPISETAGIQARLRNLGFACTQTGLWDAATADALVAFMERRFPDENPSFERLVAELEAQHEAWAP